MTTRREVFFARTSAGALVDSGSIPTWSGFARCDADGTVVSTTEPTITRVAVGTYEFPVVLTAGQYARGSIAATSPADTRPLTYHQTYEGIVTPALASDVPTAAENAAETEELLADEHGGGTWGGAGGDGSQEIALQIRDAEDDEALSSARVEIYDDATKKAEGRTDTDGNVELLLDPGTYSARVTLGGYSFSATAIVVTAPDTVAPTHVDGVALPVTSSAVVGLSRALSLAPDDAPNDDGVSGLVAGDDVTLTRSLANVPAGRTIAKVRATWKRTADNLADDEAAVVQLEATTTESAAGQVTNDGTGGTGAVTLNLTAAQHLAIAAAGATDYDLQVTYDNAKSKTPEVGTWDVVAGRTSTAP